MDVADVRARPRLPALGGLVLVILLSFLVACSSDDAPSAPSSSASTMEAIAGTSLQARVGEPVPEPPRVRITNSAGEPVRGVAVNFSVLFGRGELVGASTETNAQGEAAVEAWILGPSAGEQRVEARATGVSPVDFRATALAGSPVTMAPHAPEEQFEEVSASVPEPPAVYVEDEHGNPAEGAEVTFEVVEGGGAVEGSPAVADEEGVARVERWSLGSEPGENVLEARTGDLEPVRFSATAFPSGGVLNLAVEAVQITQGSQTLAGDIPLVEGRDALLRVFVSASHANQATPDVRVRLYRQGELLETHILPAPTGWVRREVDEGHLGRSWNLPLDGSSIRPGLGVLVDVDPEGLEGSIDPTDDIYPRSGEPRNLVVRSVPPLGVTFVPVYQSRSDLTGRVDSSNKGDFFAPARRIFPIAEYGLTLREPFTTDGPSLGGDEDAWQDLLSDIRALRAADGGGEDYYYGVVRRPGSGGIAGMGYVARSPTHIVDRAAVGVDQLPGAAWTAAHEWGHNFGRRHAPCGSPDGVDSSYPHPNARLGSWGYDLEESRMIDPDDHRDVMGYCGPRWVSDYTYDAVLDWRRRAAASDAPTPDQGIREPETGVLLWGRVSERGTAVLNPAFRVTAPPVLPDEEGLHRLVGVDADGGEVFSFAFRGGTPSHRSDPGEEHFSFVVPLQEDEIDRLRRIELRPGTGAPVVRESRLAPDAPEDMALDERIVDVEPTGAAGVRVRWDRDRYPMVLVRNPDTGRVLAFGRSGSTAVALPPRAPAPAELDILVSDGVRSVERRVPLR